MFKYHLIILILVNQVVLSQENATSADKTKGLVVYKQKINMNSTAIKLDTLRFDRQKSIFEWNLYPSSTNGVKKAKKDYPSAEVVKTPSGVAYGSKHLIFLDVAKDSLYSLMNMPHIQKVLYLKERKPRINWTIEDSTKRVGNYTVKKATADFRGRNYTAWFTPKIPLPYGPWKLHGLPGLILQAYDQSGNIYFSATNISFSDIKSIGPIILSGQEEVISLGEYKNILKQFKKLEKRAVLKKVRPYVSKKDFANMTVQLPDVHHMEIFDGDTTKQ